MRLIIILLIGLITGYFGATEAAKFLHDSKEKLGDNTAIVIASGAAEWFYQNDISHHSGRQTWENVTSFDHDQDNTAQDMIFSVERKKISGKAELRVTDLTPLDGVTSQDQAEGYISFQSPDGYSFKIVLTEFFPATIPMQTFGGVGTNVLIHGNTGVGEEKISEEFSYVAVFGLADIYKEEQLIASDKLLFVTASQKTSALNEYFHAGHYDLENPTGKMVLHVIALPYTLSSDQEFILDPIKTGFIGPNGEEQIALHVNFLENIEIVGNRFFDNKTWMNL